MYKAMTAAVLALGLGVGAAQANTSQKILAETDAAKIVTQQVEILHEVRGRRGAYRDMGDREREQLIQYQQRVIEALDGRASTTELSASQQLAVFNDLEAISALLNKAEDERMVCERTRPIGSNRPVNVCKTVAQRREERELALQGRQKDSRCLTQCGANKTGTEGW